MQKIYKTKIEKSMLIKTELIFCENVKIKNKSSKKQF